MIQGIRGFGVKYLLNISFFRAGGGLPYQNMGSRVSLFPGILFVFLFGHVIPGLSSPTLNDVAKRPKGNAPGRRKKC
jgi:hypothetical protein